VRNNKGQLAPFFIIVIAILIMAIMVTANIGKVGLHRVRTANASDSAALAGASTMANGLSQIMGMSTEMFYEYVVIQAVLASCRLSYDAAWTLYWSFLAAQYFSLKVAEKVGGDTCDSAEDTAAQFAFMNSGINENKPRNPGESYDDWRKRRGDFGQWMKDKKYKDKIDNIHEYSWEESEGAINKVSVEIHRPGGYGLTPIIVPGIVCGSIMWVGCVCHAPLPFIAGIADCSNDNDPITVKVTRTEPDKDLGLWRMRYGSISSRAVAAPYDGNVRPEPLGGREYDSKLIETE